MIEIVALCFLCVFLLILLLVPNRGSAHYAKIGEKQVEVRQNNALNQERAAYRIMNQNYTSCYDEFYLNKEDMEKNLTNIKKCRKDANIKNPVFDDCIWALSKLNLKWNKVLGGFQEKHLYHMNHYQDPLPLQTQRAKMNAHEITLKNQEIKKDFNTWKNEHVDIITRFEYEVTSSNFDSRMG